MPELPEVETVRRGLVPAMEGAKIVKLELRRKDLRFPFQKDFAARLEGRTVTGLGRRAKYLMADLSSGDVLLMRLGMSGSFRVIADGKKRAPTEHAARLVDAIHAVLNQAIAAGGSSLRDHRQTSGELGYFQHSFQVYGREGKPCVSRGCGGMVRRFTQNGRSTFWCPTC